MGEMMPRATKPKLSAATHAAAREHARRGEELELKRAVTTVSTFSRRRTSTMLHFILFPASHVFLCCNNIREGRWKEERGKRKE